MRSQPAVQVREEAIVFACEDEQLLGVISSPPAGVAPTGLGVVIVVGGPQYRAGSHRQFVQLARALAAEGHHCLRFDYRGMGDSSGRRQEFVDVDNDITAAMAALRVNRKGIHSIVLFGLCDAASAVLLLLNKPERHTEIQGIAIVNPWARTPEGQARTHLKHYYFLRLTQRDFWRKLLYGRVGAAAVRSLISSIQTLRRTKSADNAPSNCDDTEHFLHKMTAGLSEFSGPTLVALSGRDFVAREYEEHMRDDRITKVHGDLFARINTYLVRFESADHTFSSNTDSRALEQTLICWLAKIGG